MLFLIQKLAWVCGWFKRLQSVTPPYDIPIALKFGELLAEPIVIFKEFADSSNRGD